MMISSSEEKSLPQKLSEDIIAFILKENLQPGDKLPNETVLSERLNAGRSSVREAMKLLASRNIVTIRQGSGTYIASSPGMVEDPLGLTFIGNKQKLIHDLLEVRFLLEPSIAAMAATRANKKDIKKITTLCDDVEALLTALFHYLSNQPVVLYTKRQLKHIAKSQLPLQSMTLCVLRMPCIFIWFIIVNESCLRKKIPDLSDSIRKGCCPIFQKSVFSKYIFIGKISPGNSSFQGFLRGATRI